MNQKFLILMKSNYQMFCLWFLFSVTSLRYLWLPPGHKVILFSSKSASDTSSPPPARLHSLPWTIPRVDISLRRRVSPSTIPLGIKGGKGEQPYQTSIYFSSLLECWWINISPSCYMYISPLFHILIPWKVLLAPFYRSGKWDSQRWSNLLKVTQLHN